MTELNWEKDCRDTLVVSSFEFRVSSFGFTIIKYAVGVVRVLPLRTRNLELGTRNCFVLRTRNLKLGTRNYSVIRSRDHHIDSLFSQRAAHGSNHLPWSTRTLRNRRNNVKNLHRGSISRLRTWKKIARTPIRDGEKFRVSSSEFREVETILSCELET